MMKKINTYKSFNESWEEEDDDIDDSYEQSFDEIEEEDHSFDSDMTYLCDTIQSLFENSGFSVDTDYDNLNITVFVFLNKVEKIKNMTKVFDVANKLKKDILPQYESEFELYENKEGYPIICFGFNFNDDPVREEKEEWEKERNMSRLNARLF